LKIRVNGRQRDATNEDYVKLFTYMNLRPYCPDAAEIFNKSRASLVLCFKVSCNEKSKGSDDSTLTFHKHC
jgi:hypothetical protein